MKPRFAVRLLFARSREQSRKPKDDKTDFSTLDFKCWRDKPLSSHSLKTKANETAQSPEAARAISSAPGSPSGE